MMWVAASAAFIWLGVTIAAKYKAATSNTAALIEMLRKHAQNNLGVAPDTESLVYLAQHPFLSSKVREMILAAGGALGDELEQYAANCDTLFNYVKDREFQRRYPCAHAVFQYAVYLCDGPWGQKPDGMFHRRTRCDHPKDRLYHAK